MATNKSRKPASEISKAINRRKNPNRSLVSVVKNTKSYKDFLDLTPRQVTKLKTDELRAVVARLNKIEKKRIKNLIKNTDTTTSRALQGLTETGGITTANKSMSRQELMHEYKRAKAFLMGETSTVKGAQRLRTGLSSLATGSEDRILTDEEMNRLYSLLDKYKETGAISFYKKGERYNAYMESINAQQNILSMMDKGLSDDEILVKLGILSETDYAARQDTSDNFNWIGSHHPGSY